MLPDTTKQGRGGRGRPGLLLLLAGALSVLVLAVALSVGRQDFSPGEEIGAPGVEDLAVSPEATSYPDSDRPRLDGGHGVVYVYVRVERLALAGDLEVRVERWSRTSALALLFGGDGLEVVDEEEDRLGASGGGVSGVLRFAVREGSGEPLPAGRYTVDVYADGREGPVVVARKYFVVGD